MCCWIHLRVDICTQMLMDMLGTTIIGLRIPLVQDKSQRRNPIKTGKTQFPQPQQGTVHHAPGLLKSYHFLPFSFLNSVQPQIWTFNDILIVSKCPFVGSSEPLRVEPLLIFKKSPRYKNTKSVININKLVFHSKYDPCRWKTFTCTPAHLDRMS